MINIDEWYDKLECSDSWLYKGYVRRLYECARTSRGPILEIGSWLGRSLGVLALGARESGQVVVAIDPWVPWPLSAAPSMPAPPAMPDYPSISIAMPKCLSMLEKFDLRQYVIPIASTTQETTPILQQLTWGMVHVDGDHSQDGTRYDIEQTARNLMPGGYMIFHDSGYGDRPIQQIPHPGVDRAIDEWVQSGCDGCIEVESVNAEIPHRVFMRPEKVTADISASTRFSLR